MNKNDAMLTIEDLSKTFNLESPTPTSAIKSISFSINRGEFVSVLGPSGCGKSTLLKIVAGLLNPTSGEIFFNDKDKKNSLMFVFQEYNRSLFPWRNVFKNISFGLEILRSPKTKINKSVNKYIKLVKLEGFEKHYPWELSGGMQQRTAIARALVCSPKLLIMDEPYGSLDALSRSELEDDLLQIWEELQITILFVTHDIDEAIYLSDRIAILSQRPSEIIEIINVKLSRPRHQVESRNSPMFAQYRSEINRLLSRVK